MQVMTRIYMNRFDQFWLGWVAPDERNTQVRYSII